MLQLDVSLSTHSHRDSPNNKDQAALVAGASSQTKTVAFPDMSKPVSQNDMHTWQRQLETMS